MLAMMDGPSITEANVPCGLPEVNRIKRRFAEDRFWRAAPVDETTADQAAQIALTAAKAGLLRRGAPGS
jgi:hypothetical protein